MKTFKRFRPSREMLGFAIKVTSIDNETSISSYKEWADIINKKFNYNVSEKDIEDYFEAIRMLEEIPNFEQLWR